MNTYPPQLLVWTHNTDRCGRLDIFYSQGMRKEARESSCDGRERMYSHRVPSAIRIQVAQYQFCYNSSIRNEAQRDYSRVEFRKFDDGRHTPEGGTSAKATSAKPHDVIGFEA